MTVSIASAAAGTAGTCTQRPALRMIECRTWNGPPAASSLETSHRAGGRWDWAKLFSKVLVALAAVSGGAATVPETMVCPHRSATCCIFYRFEYNICCIL